MVSARLDKRRKRLFAVTQSGMNCALKRGCTAVGIEPITVHKLRKIFGTTLVRNDVNPLLISRLLRHRNINVTYDKYIRNDISDLTLANNLGMDIGSDLMTPSEIIEKVEGLIKKLKAQTNSNFKNVEIKKGVGEFSLKMVY